MVNEVSGKLHAPLLLMSLVQQLICECCAQPYYPHEDWRVQLKAFAKATSESQKYKICPLCTQAVSDQTFADYLYRARWRKHSQRLQRLWEAHERKSKNRGR